jgi:NTP pyrophosphatase (non-canonical NTP hydrolase)
MDRLRSPGGCPWDAEQTHESLMTYLVEETYETLEAIETGDRPHLREELGDLVLQVVFHSRIAAEHPDEPWSVDDVAGDIVDKLVRRHPTCSALHRRDGRRRRGGLGTAEGRREGPVLRRGRRADGAARAVAGHQAGAPGREERCRRRLRSTATTSGAG